jgi:hypothetical protein
MRERKVIRYIMKNYAKPPGSQKSKLIYRFAGFLKIKYEFIKSFVPYIKCLPNAVALYDK